MTGAIDSFGEHDMWLGCSYVRGERGHVYSTACTNAALQPTRPHGNVTAASGPCRKPTLDPAGLAGKEEWTAWGFLGIPQWWVTLMQPCLSNCVSILTLESNRLYSLIPNVLTSWLTLLDLQRNSLFRVDTPTH